MDIIKSAKNIGNEVEKGVEVVTNKLSEAFDNVASHLPFSNLAKKDDSTFHLEVELPGVKKEDIEINIEDSILSVVAVREYKNELSRDDYYVCESAFGKFERRFILPESVDTESVDAEYKDGMLILNLEKMQKAKPKTIAVK